MIHKIGYKKTNTGFVPEYKCYKLNDFNLSSPTVTTAWCLENCTYALNCYALEELIMSEDESVFTDDKRIFLAIKLMLRASDSNSESGTDGKLAAGGE